jgi:hypothetical protein
MYDDRTTLFSAKSDPFWSTHTVVLRLPQNPKNPDPGPPEELRKRNTYQEFKGQDSIRDLDGELIK